MSSDDLYTENLLLTVTPLVLNAGLVGKHAWRLTVHSLEVWTHTVTVHYSLKFSSSGRVGLVIPDEWRAFLEADVPHVTVTLHDVAGSVLTLVANDLADLEHSWIGRAEFNYREGKLPVKTLVLKVEDVEATVDVPLS